MEKLVSSWCNGTELPENYVFPAGKRPGEHVVPTWKFPVVDLEKIDGHDRANTIQQIMEAAQEFGLFQVINHGIPKELVDDSMSVFKEFFELPAEDKACLYSDNPNDNCRLFTSSHQYENEEIHYWRDCLRHNCSHLEECTQYWPQKPTRYREFVGEYTLKVRELGMRISKLIGEGLGLDPGYFGNDLSADASLTLNHYPKCPDPNLTLGLPRHRDPNLITVLLQGDVPGLEIWNNKQWVSVEPCYGAFLVVIGYQFQVISNGRLRSAEHRAVTNAKGPRTSAALFISPSKACVIAPANALVSSDNPPLYKTFMYEEFLKTYITYSGDAKHALEPYEIKS